MYIQNHHANGIVKQTYYLTTGSFTSCMVVEDTPMGLDTLHVYVPVSPVDMVRDVEVSVALSGNGS